MTKHDKQVYLVAYYTSRAASYWLNEKFYSQLKEELCKLIKLYQKSIRDEKADLKLRKACTRFLYLVMCPNFVVKDCYSHSVERLSDNSVFSFHSLNFYKLSATVQSKYNIYISWKDDVGYCRNLCSFSGTFAFRIIMYMLYPGIKTLCN